MNSPTFKIVEQLLWLAASAMLLIANVASTIKVFRHQ